jgi:glycosyltransferase involved in cell wall biosynthesis
MKIGLIIYGTLDQISGGYLYDRMLVDHLRHQGAHVEIFSLPVRNYCRHLADNFSRALPRVLETGGFDLLLQDELNHPSLFHMNSALRKTLKCPIIGIVHHLRISEGRAAWQNSLYRHPEKRYLETLDGLICNSETTRTVVEHLMSRAIPSVVAPPGGDHLGAGITAEEVSDRCRASGPLRILFTGNVLPRKGLHTLLAALDRLPDEGWQLTVAGSLSADRRYASRMERLVAGTGIKKRVELLDSVSTERLVDLMKSHHCLAGPSFYEGFGIAYLEAMGFGEPVIASTTGGVAEIITDGREGFLVPPGDCAGLAESIGRLIDDRDLLAAMSRAALRRHRAHPTWGVSMARAEDFLRGMIGRK